MVLPNKSMRIQVNCPEMIRDAGNKHDWEKNCGDFLLI